MHFTNFVADAGIKKNALGGSGFARINVRGDTNVAIPFDRSPASHFEHLFLKDQTTPDKVRAAKNIGIRSKPNFYKQKTPLQ